MNVLLINLNVGSGIEYCGNVFKKWISELPVNLTVYKDQTSESATIDFLIQHKPDIIVINEAYTRITTPVFYYKIFNPAVKVIFAIHSQKSFCFADDSNIPDYKKNEMTMLNELIKISTQVYTLDGRPLPKNYGSSNISVKFCPSEQEFFFNKLKWLDRPNKFCVVGNIYPLKVCEDFLKKAKTIPTHFDVYGKFMDKFSTKDYKILFKNSTSNNLIFKGEIPQDKVGEILNQYQYCVFPHHGEESFFMTFQQAIMTGTIPILLNDTNSKTYNGQWATWAENLYWGCDNIDDFISNLTKLATDKTDYTSVSNFISAEISKKFDYFKFKKSFQNLIFH